MMFAPENIPQELKEKRQWVNYRIEIRNDEETKIPKQPNRRNADATDPATWADFETCLHAFQNSNHYFSGIGFVFDHDYTGTDFDNCVADGEITDPDAARRVTALGTYTEYSPSGCGLHTINKATKPGSECRRKGVSVEMYDSERFFCMTGDLFNGSKIESNQEAINALYRDVFPARSPPSDSTLVRRPIRLEDEDIIRKASEAKNGKKFKRLFDGDISNYGGDDSSADLALCDMLAFWCGQDLVQMDSVFRESQLMRPKWDEKRGPRTYGEMTIMKAIEGCEEVYQGEHVEADKEAEQLPDDDIKTIALELLTIGDPMAFSLDTFETLHVGDKPVAEGIVLGTAVQSVINALGIQSKLTGGTGKGKSHGVRASVHLLPQNYVRYVSLTDKAIWYDPEIKAGCTIFSDDVKISETLEGQIKRATSNWQRETERIVPQKGSGGKIVGEIQKVPARINWLLTSVDSQGTEELINRQMGYDIDEEQDKEYTEFELKRSNTTDLEFPETRDVLICREFIRILKENEDGTLRLEGVRIPFYDRIVWNDTENRRNLNIFLDMVRGYAMLRFMQRDRDEDGNILATEDDFRAAQRHYGSRAEVQKLHLTSGALRVIEYLIKHSAIDEYNAIDSKALQNGLKLTQGRVSQIVSELRKSMYNFHSIEVRETEAELDGKRKALNMQLYYIEGGTAINLADYESVLYLKSQQEERY